MAIESSHIYNIYIHPFLGWLKMFIVWGFCVCAFLGCFAGGDLPT